MAGRCCVSVAESRYDRCILAGSFPTFMEASEIEKSRKPNAAWLMMAVLVSLANLLVRKFGY